MNCDVGEATEGLENELGASPLVFLQAVSMSPFHFPFVSHALPIAVCETSRSFELIKVVIEVFTSTMLS